MFPYFNKQYLIKHCDTRVYSCEVYMKSLQTNNYFCIYIFIKTIQLRVKYDSSSFRLKKNNKPHSLILMENLS